MSDKLPQYHWTRATRRRLAASDQTFSWPCIETSFADCRTVLVNLGQRRLPGDESVWSGSRRCANRRPAGGLGWNGPDLTGPGRTGAVPASTVTTVIAAHVVDDNDVDDDDDARTEATANMYFRDERLKIKFYCLY